MHLRSMWSVWFATLLLCQASESAAGIGSLRQRWPQGHKISACFFGGAQEARSAIVGIANEWIKGIRVSFDFGREPGFNTCEPGMRYDVRLGFAERGSWSFVGTHALEIPQDRPTINFNGLAERVDPAKRKLLLEEFGHVLGILHAEQDPKTNCFAELNLEHFLSQGLNEQDIKRRYFPPEQGGEVKPNSGEFISTGIDKWSVMRIFDRREQFKDGEKNRCYGPPTNELSDGDRKLAALMYPPKPSEVNANADPKHLTVRFEGALAPEHFGYVLDALYEKGKIQLKKHVALGEQNIRQVIAEERLAPRGVTSNSLEHFLCRINLHICTLSQGKTIWTNIEATRNYFDEGQPCGDKNFPKFVFCVPNIRLASYNVLSTVSYDAQRTSLKQLVVDKHRGCATWDENCRTLIRRLNRQYEKDFVDGERLLPRSFKGELRIPSRSYRLVVEYRDEQERDDLEKTVNAVINSRAKQLRISSDEVAIQVTYPIGSPKLQAALPAPGSGAAALEAMSYPYKGSTAAELTTLARWVHVGIWDTTIDPQHCYLEGVIHSTPSDVPTSVVPFEPPPLEKPSNCGDLRKGSYQLSLRYDHATAVAGILSAKRDDHGVAGIVPGMKIWAWEVLDGNQFNAETQHPLEKMLLQYDLNPKVINISQSYRQKVEGKKTFLYSLLFGTPTRLGMHDSILFVAAAGMTQTDTGEQIGAQIDTISGDECTIYPACWSNAEGPRGLISVVALNEKGTDLLRFDNNKPGTNHGLAFDVAAVGNVRAPFYGGWIGALPGSSAAAPYVTGLAALIAAKVRANGLEKIVSVQELKRRILFTADNDPGISTFSRYGRINFWKALNFEDDLFRQEGSSDCPHPCWKKGRITRRDASLTIIAGTFEGGVAIEPGPIKFKNIRSIKFESDSQFTVTYLAPEGLKRIFGAKIISGEQPIVQIGGALAAFDVQKFKEYVSCSWLPYCTK